MDRSRHSAVSVVLVGLFLGSVTLVYVAPLPQLPQLASRDAGSQAVVFAEGGQMDLSLATEDELLMLPGIGAARARAIMRWRCNNPLARLDDLLEVEGIGPATLEQLERFVKPEFGAFNLRNDRAKCPALGSSSHESRR